MSYSYGPTVVYAPAILPMDAFGGPCFEAQENIGRLASCAPPKASSAGSRSALGNLSNLSNVGCYADGPADGCRALEDSCCGSRGQQAASTSSRPPLADKQATTQPRRSTGGPGRQARRNNWVDIDAQNKDNPLACAEYAEAIFQHLSTAELLNRPDPQYLESMQRDMSPHMRCILVDWLVEVAQEYRLTSDTLHLTLALLDRFLSLCPVAREELQLAGVAAMWVAAKFEEVYAPTASNFCYITDNTYEPSQLVEMEARLLSTLSYVVAVPTAKTFQRRFLQASAADAQLHYAASFLLETALLDEGLLPYLPSQLAAASVYAARAMLGQAPWDGTLAHYARYSADEVGPIARELAWSHARTMAAGQFTAVRDKYASDKLLCVSGLAPCAALLPEGAEEELRALLAGGGSPGSPGGSSGSGADASGSGLDMDME